MTNLIATVTASLLSVLITNWNVVGNLNLTIESRSFFVQQGTVHTNFYLVYPRFGSNQWHLLSSDPGPVLPQLQLVERINMPRSNRVPSPLPEHSPVTLTNVGSVLIDPPKKP